MEHSAWNVAQERGSCWCCWFPSPWKHHGPGKRVFVKDSWQVPACLSSGFFCCFFWAVTWWDQDWGFFLARPPATFSPFVGMQIYPNPDWLVIGTPVTCWFTASTPFSFPVILQVYYSLGHTWFLPWHLVFLIHLLQHKKGGRFL